MIWGRGDVVAFEGVPVVAAHPVLLVAYPAAEVGGGGCAHEHAVGLEEGGHADALPGGEEVEGGVGGVDVGEHFADGPVEVPVGGAVAAGEGVDDFSGAGGDASAQVTAGPAGRRLLGCRG